MLREVGSGTRSAFETSIEQLGLAPRLLKVVLELPSNEAILDAVEAGGGATVISELVTDAAPRSGRLRRVPIDLPARPFHYPPSRAVPLQGGRCIPRHCSGRQVASRTGAAQVLAFTDPACRNDKINPLDPLAGARHMPSRQHGSMRGPTIRRASHDHSCDYVGIIAS